MKIKTNIVNSITNEIRGTYETVAKSSNEYKAVAQRSAELQKLGVSKTRIAVGKGYLIGAFRPIINKLNSSSDSFDLLTKTYKKVRRNGVKNSAPEIKNALKELSGVYDVKSATETEGKIAGIKEAGKAGVRLISSISLFTIGNFIPVLGASAAGWIAGEKLAEKIIGKPYTKKLKNLL